MFSSSTKIMMSNDKKLDKFKSGIFQTLLEVEMNVELKA
jgi:hypothetical protein